MRGKSSCENTQEKKTLAEDGIQMDFNALQWQKALVSIRVSLESDSNVSHEREEVALTCLTTAKGSSFTPSEFRIGFLCER
jgi:hypothetical protein